jgi:arsenate reductase
MLIEALGTALLLFFIFALVDRRNRDAPGATLAPFFIGFAVAFIISVLAALTQAGLNPARDLGPRLFALPAGWGPIALPGPNGVWWTYVVGTCVGGPIGATLYDTLIGATPPHRPQRTQQRAACTHVRPLAIQAMAELGVDISGQQSKTLDRYLGEPFDAVITVCDQANEACPVFFGARTRLHWGFPDPSHATGTQEEQLLVYRAVRDAIRARIEADLLALQDEVP